MIALLQSLQLSFVLHFLKIVSLFAYLFVCWLKLTV